MTNDNADPFEVLRSSGAPDGLSDNTIQRALEAVRKHLGMQVAYVSEFVGNRTFYREVDGPGFEQVIQPGDSMSLDDVYCRHILEGRLPEVIPDTADVPFTARIPMTAALGIRAHISVPISLPDGRTYGMFCCVSTQPEPSLNARDLKMMRAFADLTAVQISRDLDAITKRHDTIARIRKVIDDNELAVVFQPIFRLSDDRVVGFECLSRFSGPEKHTPDVWFGLAASVGMGVELELAAIRKGLGALQVLPEDVYVTLNASPEVIVSGALRESIGAAAAKRVVLEVTEHATINDYSALIAAVEALRCQGARLAVDDAGAGYSSLRHILALRPDIIKLDISLTRDVNSDPARSALASALVHFAEATESHILAEGVETAMELQTLKDLGVDSVQGFYLGRPGPLEAALKLVLGPSRKGTKEVA